MNDGTVEGNAGDDRAELRQTAFELAITLEAISVGLEALGCSPAAAHVRDELSTLVLARSRQRN